MTDIHTTASDTDTDELEDVVDDGRRRRIVLTSIGLAVVLAVGVSIGFLIPVLRAPADASAEAGFARDMSTHHAQAVDMAMTAYQRSTNPEVRTIALDMGLTQQGQIGVMQTWLKHWRLSPTGSQPRMAWMNQAGMNHGGGTPSVRADGLMPGMATTAELDRLRAASGRELDILFCDLMIRHHQGGITMVDAVLATDPADEVRELATSMRNGQQNEINALTAIRDRAKSG